MDVVGTEKSSFPCRGLLLDIHCSPSYFSWNILFFDFFFGEDCVVEKLFDCSLGGVKGSFCWTDLRLGDGESKLELI